MPTPTNSAHEALLNEGAECLVKLCKDEAITPNERERLLMVKAFQSGMLCGMNQAVRILNGVE